MGRNLSAEQGQANARLIAAAPDMLAALREAQSQFRYMMERMHSVGAFYPNADSEVATRLQEIDAAIAKATGDSERSGQ